MCIINNDFKVIVFFVITSFFYRSTKGILRLSASERVLITIPNDVKDILVDILLGDAHIVQRSPTSNSRLVYAQTSIKHKEYFDYVFSFFISFCVKNYIPQVRKSIESRTNNTYTALSFTTMQLPCFNIFREMFYKSNVKMVPDNIYELLTPKGLAF